MGLREKIALVLTTLAVTQITITRCVPSGSRSAALQRHLEARGIKSTQSLFDNVAKVTKTAPPKRSMYKAYNFPETEYPVDSSPRDPFYYGLDPVGLAEHEAPTQNFKAFNDMKKAMRMKRKLNMINENHQTSSDPEPIWVTDKDLFPEVQYPLKSMDTWVPFYGNPSVLTQNEHRHKFSELLFEKSKRTSEPHKEDMKLKTKRLLDEINKIKEKMSSKAVGSKCGTNSTGLFITSDSPTSATRIPENLINTDTNATQVSFQTIDALNDERLANLITLNSSETEDFTKQLYTANITTISDELPRTFSTDYGNTSVMLMPIPYKACESKNKTGNGDLKNENVSTLEEELKPSIILENKDKSSAQSNASLQTIENSTRIDNTGDNFQQVITDALIDLILTHINSKNNKKKQALVSNDNDTQIYRNSDAILELVKDEQSADLLPNDAQKQQDIDLMLNDDPLNVKLPLPGSSKDENISAHVYMKNDTLTSDVNKATCSPIIVIPVGDSINKIQLPIVETTTGAPIIVFIPTTQQNNISASPSTNISFALPFVSEGDSNVSFENSPNISFTNEYSQNSEAISDSRTVEEISIKNIPINTHENRNATSVNSDFETLPDNSMCHNHNSIQYKETNVTQQTIDTIIKKNVPIKDIVSKQDNPSSASLDHQSSIESFTNTNVEEVSNDEKTIEIDNLAKTEVGLAKPLLLDDNVNKDNLYGNKFFATDSQNIDPFKVEDNVSSVNAPADTNNQTDASSSKVLASSSSVSKDYQLPNQRATISNIQKISSGDTMTDINNFPKIISEVPVKPSPLNDTEENEKGIRQISDSNTPENDQQEIIKNNANAEENEDVALLPLNKLSEIQDADVIKKNSIALNKTLKEVNNEVQVDEDTPLEDKNIKGRSLSDSTNDVLKNSKLQSNAHKVIHKDTSVVMKDELETTSLQATLDKTDKHLLSVQTDSNESPSSKNNTLLRNIHTNITENDPISNDSITNDVMSPNAAESADANESQDCLISCVNQNQLINSTDSLVYEDLIDSTHDKNQHLPHVDNPPSDRNEDNLDLIEHNDFFRMPFDITKDGLSLPKGMLICSGISEVPRNVKNGSIMNETVSSPVIKQNYIANANIDSGEVLQETPVTEIAKDETMGKDEVRQFNELTNNEKAVSKNDKTILDNALMNKTVNSTQDDSPHYNIVDNDTLLSDTDDVKNNTGNIKESPDTKPSETINESILLTVDKTNNVTNDNIPLQAENNQENLSEDGIQDAPTQVINKPRKSADNDVTSSELSGLIKYLYDAV